MASVADLVALVSQGAEQLGALVDTERRRREEVERAARASARALEQKKYDRMAPPPVPPIISRQNVASSSSSSNNCKTADLAAMRRQNRQLREAVLAADQRNAARKKQLEDSLKTAARQKQLPLSVPPPGGARKSPRAPAAASRCELRRLRAEFAVAQQDKLVLQAQESVLQQALSKAAETRDREIENLARERRAHASAAAGAPRRRRIRPEAGV